MANRYFEDAHQAKLYKECRNTPPRALVQCVVDYLKQKYTGELKLAIDVGCGSGQNTFLLAEFFQKVIGFDISASQIDNAVQSNSLDNVSFSLGPAEEINLADDSVQLLTAVTAVHWFDLPKFFDEGLRVLSPGGVLAIYTHGISKLCWAKNPSKTEAISDARIQMILNSELTEFWSPEVLQFGFSKYGGLEIPYDDFVRIDDDELFYSERTVSLTLVLREMETWSGFQRYKQSKGPDAAQEVADKLKNKILDLIKEDLPPGEESVNPENIFFVERTPYFLLMARKPLMK